MKNIADTARTYFESIQDEMIRDTLAWSNLNSGTGNLAGVRQMMDIFREQFNNLGARTELVDSVPFKTVDATGRETVQQYAPNLIARFRPECSKRILFTGHADTVFAKDHPFQDSHIDQMGRLRGPGVADMKGGIRMLLAALGFVERHALAAGLGFDVAINSDEETGSLGSSTWMQSIAPDYMAALIVEPAMPDGSLAGARAGSANMSIAFTGTPAHAGREFTKGRNAVIAAADVAVAIAALRR